MLCRVEPSWRALGALFTSFPLIPAVPERTTLCSSHWSLSLPLLNCSLETAPSSAGSRRPLSTMTPDPWPSTRPGSIAAITVNSSLLNPSTTPGYRTRRSSPASLTTTTTCSSRVATPSTTSTRTLAASLIGIWRQMMILMWSWRIWRRSWQRWIQMSRTIWDTCWSRIWGTDTMPAARDTCCHGLHWRSSPRSCTQTPRCVQMTFMKTSALQGTVFHGLDLVSKSFRCLANAGIYPEDTRNQLKQNRFNTFSPTDTFHQTRASAEWVKFTEQKVCEMA